MFDTETSERARQSKPISEARRPKQPKATSEAEPLGRPPSAAPIRKRQSGSDTRFQSAPASDDGLRSVVASIRQLWPIRQAWHRAEKSLVLAAKAKCRAFTEGDKPKANALFDAARQGEAVDDLVAMMLRPFLAAIEPLERERAIVEKRLLKLAPELPVYRWMQSVKGFGELNLVGIVGEAGDVGSYRNPSCLWKRMGLAVIDGGRQRKCSDADLALIHGYSPQRRSVTYLLGESLSKHQLISKEKSGTEHGKSAGPYGEVYIARRKATAISHPDWTDMHRVKDARRIMTKAALRDLWCAWRQARSARPMKPRPSVRGPE